MVKSVFGDNLALLRKLKGLTRKQLANELKINETTLAGYENLGREPKYSVLVTIADYFDVSVDKLIRGKIEFDNQVVGKQGDDFIFHIKPKENKISLAVFTGLLNSLNDVYKKARELAPADKPLEIKISANFDVPENEETQ